MTAAAAPAAVESRGRPDDPPAPVPAPPAALYVHVPFCVSLCPYCDFVVYPGAAARGPRSRVRAYLEAVAVELRLRADALDERFGPAGTAGRRGLESVYLGGGTPSLLPAGAIADLLALVRSRFGLAPGAEVTIEANPGRDERGDAVALRAAGVTRVSIGAQSLQAAELHRLGRRHSPVDVAETVSGVRAAGIPSVGLDLLYDLPGASLATWAATLDQALALEPDHLSLYALTLDGTGADGPAGPFDDHLPTPSGARRWRQAARGQQDEDRAAGQYDLAVRRLARDGWLGYEISNWARPGHESRHNLAYWRRRPSDAAGPGAHAFDGVVRRWNAARLDGWLAALLPGGGRRPSLPPGGSEIVDAATAAVEEVILGLRLQEGLPLATALRPPLADHVGWARANDLLEAASDRIRLTTRGRLLSNELFARLL